MKSVGDILKLFDPIEDKYISREFQAYGIFLSEELHDDTHKSLYIKLAKNESRALLEKALSFVKDSNAHNRGRLFMWKLKQLKTGQKGEDAGIVAGIHVVLKGRVQGVGCRAFVQAQATKLHLVGWVKNQKDGSVEIAAEGKTVYLRIFLSYVSKGPPNGRIDSVRTTWQKPTGICRDFRVLY